MPSHQFKGEQHLIDYLSMMDELAAVNGGNLMWWATKIASKHRFLSPLQELMGDVCPQQVPTWKKALHTLLWGRDLIRHGLKIVSRARKARVLFGPELDRGNPKHLIKSFAYSSSMRDGHFFDPFFGRLAKIIRNSPHVSHEVLTVVTDFDESDETMKQLAQLPKHDVVPIEYFITGKDVFEAVARLICCRLFSSFKVPDDLEYRGKNVSSSVRTAIKGIAGQIDLQHMLHQSAARRIATDFDLASCVMTYEGNPWERIFVAGLHEGQPGVPVAGYQHSVVPPAAAGVFPGPHEMQSASLPDQILTTGEVTARIIRKFSAYPDEKVTPLGALRYEYLYDLPVKKRRKGDGVTVLVVPEGVPEALDIVAYALQQAREFPHIQFRVRTHPLTPLSGFMERLGASLDDLDNYTSSDHVSIIDDIMDCDAVLYWGSTVSLEALMVGTPLIHFDRGDVLPYDPLFSFADFKWTVRGEDSINDVLSAIVDLSDDEYGLRAASGRAYVEAYFHPVVEDLVAKFFKW